MSTETKPYAPIEGPMPLSPEWYAAHLSSIGASRSAQALNLSEHGQAIGLYLEMVGLVDPFEGNEYTERGKRFAPFAALEFTAQTGHKIRTGLPMYYSPTHPFISATPDGVFVDDPLHGVEFKACNFRRAAQLGQEQSDQIFSDWLLQCQQQMFVMGWSCVTVMVMVSLHEYKIFEVERNESLIEKMVEGLTDFWQHVLDQNPPEPNFDQPGTVELMKRLHPGKPEGDVTLTEEQTADALELFAVRAQIKELETTEERLQSRVLFSIGDAAVAHLPGADIELTRGFTQPLLWTQKDIDAAIANIGKQKKAGFSSLRKRQAT
jgi:putative phage-type endonuclease